jgi:hypothetical protein
MAELFCRNGDKQASRFFVGWHEQFTLVDSGGSGYENAEYRKAPVGIV